MRWLLWIGWTIAPSASALFAQQLYVGVVVAIAFSALLGYRRENALATVFITLGLLVSAAAIGIAVVFAGCLYFSRGLHG